MLWLRSGARRGRHGASILDFGNGGREGLDVSGALAGKIMGKKRRECDVRPNTPAPIIRMEDGGFRARDGEVIRHEEHRSREGHVWIEDGS